MKVRFGLPLALALTTVYTAVMIGLNNRYGEVTVYQAVAGAQTERSTTYEAKQPQALTASINKARIDAGTPSILEDTRLNTLATLRLQDMIANHYYAHTAPDGTNFADILEDVGLSKTTQSCENLLLTNVSDSEAMTAEWLVSPTHKDCMLNTSLNSVGVAQAVFDEATGQILVVTIYARVR